MSNVSLTPAGGWYADPMDAGRLRWWDGVNWTPQTTPATGASADSSPATGPVAPVTPLPVAPEAPMPPAAAELAPAAPAPAAPTDDQPGIYIPRNSVFKMAEAVDGQAYLTEWSGIADISDEVALSGVPVQLALTATPSEGPPIPVSADAFPILGLTPEPEVVPERAAPAWQVEQPLAKPIDQLFPIAGPPAPTAPVAAPVTTATSSFPTPVAPVPLPPSPFSIATAHAPAPEVDVAPEPTAPRETTSTGGPTLSPDIFPTAAPASALTAAPAPTGALFPGLVPDFPEPSPVAEDAPTSIPVLAAVPDLVETPTEWPAVPAAMVAPAPLVAAEAAPSPEPVAPQPVAPQPIAPQPVAVAPQPVAPQPVAVAPQPVAPQPALAPAPVFAEPEPEPEPAPEPAPVAEAVVAVAAPAAVPPAPVFPPAPVAQEATLYAGPSAAAIAAPLPTPLDAPAPALTEMPSPGIFNPVAAGPVAAGPVNAGPVAAGPVDYDPVVARAIPQPAQFGAPVDTVAPPLPQVAAPEVSSPAAAPETPWPAEGTYQPHPGAYVPFDPNAVRAEEPVPVIPFSSRDPFNPASTSRPDLRSYGSAVGPSGSTYTGALILILLTPLLLATGYALLFQLSTIDVGLAPNIALAALMGVVFFVGVGAAQFDRNKLAKRGYFDLASPFWILLTPLTYLGVRASRLHSQGPGGIRAVLLWFAACAAALTILGFSTFTALTQVTPDRVAQTEQAISQRLTVGNVVPTVSCDTIPSFAAGTVFNCTATASGADQLVQVTITEWVGTESYKVVGLPTAKTATTPQTPTAP